MIDRLRLSLVQPTNVAFFAAFLVAIHVTLLFSCPNLRGQEPPITDVAFAPDGKRVVACSQNGLQVFSWPELKLQKTSAASAKNLHCLAFSPDGKQLAVGGGNPSEEGIVEIFSWPDCKSSFKLSNHDDSITSVVWQSNTKLFSASLDRLLSQWDVEQRKLIKRYQGHSRGVSSVCVLGDGKLATAGHDQSVRVWNFESGELLQSLNQHSKPINKMALRPVTEGLPIVASAASDRSIRFWQPTIGRMMRYVRLESIPLDIAWINESHLVASCVDGQACLVNTDDVQILQTIPGIKGWAYAVAIHPEDGTIVIAGSDGQIRRVSLPSF